MTGDAGRGNSGHFLGAIPEETELERQTAIKAAGDQALLVNRSSVSLPFTYVNLPSEFRKKCEPVSGRSVPSLQRKSADRQRFPFTGPAAQQQAGINQFGEVVGRRRP